MSRVNEEEDLSSIITRAESCLVAVEEMTSGSESSEVDQLAAAVSSVIPCCELSSRLPPVTRPGLDCLLDVALSEEFSK